MWFLIQAQRSQIDWEIWYIFKSFWDLWATRNLTYTRRSVWNHNIFIHCCFFSKFETSIHLLQSLWGSRNVLWAKKLHLSHQQHGVEGEKIMAESSLLGVLCSFMYKNLRLMHVAEAELVSWHPGDEHFESAHSGEGMMKRHHPENNITAPLGIYCLQRVSWVYWQSNETYSNKLLSLDLSSHNQKHVSAEGTAPLTHFHNDVCCECTHNTQLQSRTQRCRVMYRRACL